MGSEAQGSDLNDHDGPEPSWNFPDLFDTSSDLDVSFSMGDGEDAIIVRQLEQESERGLGDGAVEAEPELDPGRELFEAPRQLLHHGQNREQPLPQEPSVADATSPPETPLWRPLPSCGVAATGVDCPAACVNAAGPAAQRPGRAGLTYPPDHEDILLDWWGEVASLENPKAGRDFWEQQLAGDRGSRTFREGHDAWWAGPQPRVMPGNLLERLWPSNGSSASHAAGSGDGATGNGGPAWGSSVQCPGLKFVGPAQPKLFVSKVGMSSTGGSKTRYARPVWRTAAASEQQQRGGPGGTNTMVASKLYFIDKYSFTAKYRGLTVYKQMLAELEDSVDEVAYKEWQKDNIARKGDYPVNEWAMGVFEVKEGENSYVRLRWRSWWPALYIVNAPKAAQKQAAAVGKGAAPAAAACMGRSRTSNVAAATVAQAPRQSLGPPTLSPAPAAGLLPPPQLQQQQQQWAATPADTPASAAALLGFSEPDLPQSFPDEQQVGTGFPAGYTTDRPTQNAVTFDADLAVELGLFGQQSSHPQQSMGLYDVSIVQQVDPSAAGPSSLSWLGNQSQSLPVMQVPAQPHPQQLPQPLSVQGLQAPSWLPPPPPQQQQHLLPPHQQQPTVEMQHLHGAALVGAPTPTMAAAPGLYGQGHGLLLCDTQPLSQPLGQLAQPHQLSLPWQHEPSLSHQQLTLQQQQQQQQQALGCGMQPTTPMLQHAPMPQQQPAGSGAISFPPMAVAPHLHQPLQQVNQLEAHAPLTTAHSTGLYGSTAVPAGRPPPSVITAEVDAGVIASLAGGSSTAAMDTAAASGGPSSMVVLQNVESPQQLQAAGAHRWKRAAAWPQQGADELAGPERQLAAAGQQQSRAHGRRLDVAPAIVEAGAPAGAAGLSDAAGAEAGDTMEGEAAMLKRQQAQARVRAIEKVLPGCLELGVCGIDGAMDTLRVCITKLGDAKDMLALRDYHDKGYGLLNIMLHAAIDLGAGTGASGGEVSHGGDGGNGGNNASSSRGVEIEKRVVEAFEVISERLKEVAATAGSLPAKVACRMLLTQQDRDWHDTPSHICARYNLLVVQQWLLERCDARMLLVATKDGWLPLATACRAGNLEAATAFLRKARELGLFESDKLHYTKVILADLTVFNKHYRTSGARMLLEKALREVWPDGDAPAVFEDVDNADDLKRVMEQLQTMLLNMDLNRK